MIFLICQTSKINGDLVENSLNQLLSTATFIISFESHVTK